MAEMLLAPLLSGLMFILEFVFFSVLGVLAFLLIRFVICCRGFPLLMTPASLRKVAIRSKFFDFLRWLVIDFKERSLHVGEFTESGFTFYVGRQGSGKTSAMVEYLNRMHKKYPKCVIVTNFKYTHANFIMRDWEDLLNVRNGTDGVIFAIDEIHSEYSAAAWKDVPENLLSEISQQRKQRIKIVGTAQFFGRVAKPLREQSSTVVVCSCVAGRMVRTRTYDSNEYSACIDNVMVVTKKLKPIGRYNFVLSDELRSCFDTYEKINRMRKMEAQNRKEGRHNATH